VLLATGFQQLGANILATQVLQDVHDEGYYFTVHQPGLLTAAEQRDWFSLLKVVEKSSSQSRLPKLLANNSARRNADIGEVQYFNYAPLTISALEPPDIIFPFHYFW